MDYVYIQYHKRSTTNPDFVWPVKTRVNQSPPRSDQHVILILDGSHVVQGHYIGKAVFEINNGNSYDFTRINNENLIHYRDLATYAAEDAVPVDDTQFVPVLHNGRCGYDAIGQALGFPINPEDPEFIGKKVFNRLIQSGYDFKCAVTDEIMESDFLDSRFWLTSDISKFLFISICLFAV
jgi:hypothetical protein